jgi:hypothetical protein
MALQGSLRTCSRRSLRHSSRIQPRSREELVLYELLELDPDGEVDPDFDDGRLVSLFTSHPVKQ